MSSEIGVKIYCPIIVRRFQFFSLGTRGLPFSLSPAPGISYIQLQLAYNGYLTCLMRAARNLPLDSSLKFGILLAVPSCCTFTMLHYGLPSAVAQKAVMIEPELEVPIPEQSAPIPAASIPPAAISPAVLACCITARRMIGCISCLI